jgi:hypothetical protein
MFLFTLPILAQKNKKERNKGDKIENEIPSIKQKYLRFSLFAFDGTSYLHRETNNVWMETFLEIRSDVSIVLLPGLGDRQSCSYRLEECSFIENEEGLQLIVLPIECGKDGEPMDKRIMRIHLVKNNRNTDYIFSLSYMEEKDLVLFHNYSDMELGKYLTNKAIRFQ